MDNQRKTGVTGHQVWFDGRQAPLERQDLWGLIHNSAIDHVVVTLAQRMDQQAPRKTHWITEVNSPEELAQVPAGEIVLSPSREVLESAREKGYSTCALFLVEGREALDQAWQEAEHYDFAIVDFDLPTNIPLELILARLQNRNTVILKRERGLEDMKVAFGVMEHGSDGVLLVCDDPVEISRVDQFLKGQKRGRLNLEPLVVTEVRHIGMGSRACIDTTDLMGTDEGMLVGSTSSGGIFVCSETHYLPYMNLRPFRVNAGAIHSYVWMPDDAAEYLSDLKAGSRVLCVNTLGECRELTVGRVKIEVRPLLLIRGKVGETELNVIVQDDWHIRIMDAEGNPRNASTLRPGDRLLAYVCNPGRHVGIKVDETIIER